MASVKWSFEFTSNISRKVISIKLKFAFKLSHLPSMRTMHETVQFVTHYMYQKINEYRCSEISNLLNAAEVSRNLMRWKLHKYSKVYLSKVVRIKFMIISILTAHIFIRARYNFSDTWNIFRYQFCTMGSVLQRVAYMAYNVMDTFMFVESEQNSSRPIKQIWSRTHTQNKT